MWVVGSRELESPTSSVSRKRSNQLSYEPVKSATCMKFSTQEPVQVNKDEFTTDPKSLEAFSIVKWSFEDEHPVVKWSIFRFRSRWVDELSSRVALSSH